MGGDLDNDLIKDSLAQEGVSQSSFTREHHPTQRGMEKWEVNSLKDGEGENTGRSKDEKLGAEGREGALCLWDQRGSTASRASFLSRRHHLQRGHRQVYSDLCSSFSYL